MCLAVPGEILSIDEKDQLSRSAKVSFAGTIKDINLATLPEAKVGDYVAVHAGFALNIIDKEEALKSISYFEELDDYLEEG